MYADEHLVLPGKRARNVEDLQDLGSARPGDDGGAHAQY
jgi:hypothetical protein